MQGYMYRPERIIFSTMDQGAIGLSIKATEALVVKAQAKASVQTKWRSFTTLNLYTPTAKKFAVELHATSL